MNLDLGTCLVISRCLKAQGAAHRGSGAAGEDFANHCARLVPLFSGGALVATLSHSERTIILAAVQAQAMAFGKAAKAITDAGTANAGEAVKLMAFAGECDRVVQMLESRH